MVLLGVKNLLITDRTGCCGNAVLRCLLDNNTEEIRIFSLDEKKQDDMRHELQNPKVKFYIDNIRDRQAVDGVMKGVDYIFSAAALKQVPCCPARITDCCAHRKVEGSAVKFAEAILRPMRNCGWYALMRERGFVARVRNFRPEVSGGEFVKAFEEVAEAGNRAGDAAHRRCRGVDGTHIR